MENTGTGTGDGFAGAPEVKTRTAPDPHVPPVGHAQRRRLVRAALAWQGYQKWGRYHEDYKADGVSH